MILVEFASRRIPAELVAARVPDADGFVTNVECLHARATGAVSYTAYVIVTWAGDLRTRAGRRAQAEADGLADRLWKLGYLCVRVEREGQPS